MSTRKVEVVRAGTWLYDGRVERAVRILRQTWDHYHEAGWDDEAPDLNDQGHAYYVVWGEPSPPEPGREDWGPQWPSRSRTCLSLEDAVALAERTIGSDIAWDVTPNDQGSG